MVIHREIVGFFEFRERLKSGRHGGKTV